ncbi:MAG: SRPBCC domain-containing protein [Flavobacteriales bacterium]|nr:SRPBCC domain-containing protein [Flavobacteriales bacterium]MCL4283371.1 SRPBCC domain-containing protein [Flavobacteriales bacterium]
MATRPVRTALKQRYQMEFYLNASVASLYEFISTPSGFSEWFCDDVNVVDNMYTFRWGDDTEMAECLSQRIGEYVRFRWAEDTQEDPAAFFELRIRVDGMTNETCLLVTDHAWPQDLEEERALWEAQVHKLIRVLGA